MATSIESRLRTAITRQEAKGIRMNDFGIAFFSQTLSSIGTDGLGSCSVVLIVSQHAALLGHVSPLPDNANLNDPLAGDNHVRSFMDRLTQYYLQHQQYFPQSPHSWVVCAVYRNSVALPDQRTIMETKLRNVGLNVDISKTYDVPTLTDHLDRGSVFVDARGSTVQVYVEGTVVQEVQKARTSTASQFYTATPSTTTGLHSQQQSQQIQQTPSDWIWSTEYKRYFRRIGTAVEWAPQ
ncbi:hypothetical protein EJ07DRAFT_159076 [Lizonia empirigonia]|nr:hypothetical protein EJ07DRAFT_159076 [Lizonia empirigonia]